MAAPHVAGVAAYLIALEGLASPAAVDARIKELGVVGVVTSPGASTTNKMVWTGASAIEDVTV